MDPKHFYDTKMPEKLGNDYEYARWFRNDFQRAQYLMMSRLVEKRVIPFLRGVSDILEVGAGAGTWTKMLRKVFVHASYTIVDISAEMLAQAKRTLGNDITYIESDLVSFSVQNGFDAVFSSRAIEYMPDKKRAVCVLHTALKSGGKGVIITKTPKRFIDRLARRKLSAFHQGQIAPQELAHLLRESGFIVERICIATASVPLLRSPRLNIMAFSILSLIPGIFLLPIFSESYAVFFRKPL